VLWRVPDVVGVYEMYVDLRSTKRKDGVSKQSLQEARPKNSMSQTFLLERRRRQPPPTQNKTTSFFSTTIGHQLLGTAMFQLGRTTFDVLVSILGDRNRPQAQARHGFKLLLFYYCFDPILR
jgi:hypothetical protein